MSIVRFKSFMQERVDLSETGEETLLSVSEYYGVKSRKDAFSQEAFESRAASLEGYRRVFENDLVMNYMLAWKGAYGVSNFSGIVSPAYAVFKINSQKAFPSYVHYCLRSERFKSYFRAHSKGIIESRLRLYPDTFLSLSIDLPDYETQKEIAAFLDRETARIDQLIEKKERLIYVLKERETEALKARIKQLEVDPKTCVWKLAHICKIQRGKFGFRPRNAPELYGGEAPFLQTGDVARADKYITEHKQTLSALGETVSAKFPKGTLLMAIAANVGNLAITTYEAYCPDSVVGFVPGSRIDNEFLYYTLRAISNDVSSSSTSNAQDNTNVARLGGLKILLPERETQRDLVKEFRAYEGSMYKISAKINSSIEALQNYKTSLITESVTGQLDIGSWKKRGKTDSRLDQIEEAMAS